MNKESKKQKAIELFRSGLSFGKISDQIGEPKTTVYRWIGQIKKENRKIGRSSGTIGTSSGTTGTPIGTGIGTDNGKNDTNPGTNLPKEQVAGTTDPKKRNEYYLESDSPKEFEFLKAKLDHEFQMAKLSFEKEQYQDKKKADADAKEMERLKQDLIKAKKDNEELQSKRNYSQQKVIVELPQSYVSLLANIMKQYLNYDDQECSIEFIESLYEQVRGLESEIKDWAISNDFNLEDGDTLDIIKKIISDIQETINYFEEEDADILHISFNKAWKAEMEDWIESIN